MAYKIIQHKDPQLVVDRVSEEMKRGWIPQGGLAIASYFHPGAYTPHTIYAQAMVKG